MQARNHNWKTRPAQPYAVGDLVWLAQRLIPSTRPSSKLDYRRIGPFQVSKPVGTNAAQLELGSNFHCLHPVFNVSLLTPYIDPTMGRQPVSTATSSDQPSLLPILTGAMSQAYSIIAPKEELIMSTCYGGYMEFQPMKHGSR